MIIFLWSCISEYSHNTLWVGLAYLWMLTYHLMSEYCISLNAHIALCEWNLHIFECLHIALWVGRIYLRVLIYLPMSGVYVSLSAHISSYEWGLHISECSHITRWVGLYIFKSSHIALWVGLAYLRVLTYHPMSGTCIFPCAHISPYKWGIYIIITCHWSPNHLLLVTITYH